LPPLCNRDKPDKKLTRIGRNTDRLPHPCSSLSVYTKFSLIEQQPIHQ
jgi:hypothetical protein